MIKLILSLFVMLVLAFQQSEGQADQMVPNFNVHQLSDGVFACVHQIGGKAICNSTIIDNGEATIIFDSFLSPEAAEDLKDVVDEYNLSPIKYVVNSHYHNDHIRGNQVFNDGVIFISTKRTAELIEEMEPLEILDEQTYAVKQYQYYDSLYHNFSGSKDERQFQQILIWRPYFQVLSQSFKEIKTVVPTKFVFDSLSLDGSQRRVKLITHGEGHTESDLIAYLPDDKILVTGDLIFNNCHPYLGHGNIAALHKWYNYFDSLAIEYIIPGHGEVGQALLISQMRNYLFYIQNTVNEWKLLGKEVADLEDLTIPENYKDWWFERFYISNLKFVLHTSE